jgi:hypothetical protein
MTRKTARELTAPVPVAVPVIHESAIYTPETARRTLGLRKSTIAREVRLGRLRASRRGGRHFILGRWLIAWVENGEVRRGQRNAVDRNGAD